MESNDCICVNYYLKVLQNMLNSIANASVMIARNSNTPATDSGYITNQNSNGQGVQSGNSGQNNFLMSTDWISTGFYLGMIIIAILLLLNGLKKKKSKLN
jgi:hypothetical protein